MCPAAHCTPCKPCHCEPVTDVTGVAIRTLCRPVLLHTGGVFHRIRTPDLSVHPRKSRHAIFGAKNWICSFEMYGTLGYDFQFSYAVYIKEKGEMDYFRQ